MKTLLQSSALKALLLTIFAALASASVQQAAAQQKVGYVDSEYILDRTPEFASVQQQLDRLAQEWQREIESRQREVDEMFTEYQARELLYTQEERRSRREAIVDAEESVEGLRNQYFGPEGELFKQQENLLKPIQERVLAAVEQVARDEEYDYVFDKSGDFLFLFAQDEFDLSNRVLEELGIDIESTERGSSR